ncbi:MAG: hypothetical protein H0T51_07915 [Pirellulales bacterium]|nr:hypothetical protein [Pirellulales bacterium]
MKCEWVLESENLCRCANCGETLIYDDPDNCHGECQIPGWGDRFAAWLKARGITPWSYRRLKVRCGFTDACNCSKRQAKLNRVGLAVKAIRKR